MSEYVKQVFTGVYGFTGTASTAITNTLSNTLTSVKSFIKPEPEPEKIPKDLFDAIKDFIEAFKMCKNSQNENIPQDQIDYYINEALDELKKESGKYENEKKWEVNINKRLTALRS